MQLDNSEAILKKMEAENAVSLLWPAEILEWEKLTPEVRMQKLLDMCENPLHDFSVVYRWYFRLKWTGIFNHFLRSNVHPHIVEIGSGSSDIIPTALAKVSEKAVYTSVNMNDDLSDGLLAKTGGLPLHIELVRDDAINILNHLPQQETDIVVFEHSANDILQAMLAEKNGYDTIKSDWFTILPRMIELINAAYISGSLEENLKDSFVQLLRNCFTLLRPGGVLVISHYMFQYDLDLGYHPALWENMLPVIRPWVNELPGGAEIAIDGFSPQWWLFYRKDEQ